MRSVESAAEFRRRRAVELMLRGERKTIGELHLHSPYRKST